MSRVSAQQEKEFLHALSFFAINGEKVSEQASQYLADLDQEGSRCLISLADLHHVSLRALPLVNATDVRSTGRTERIHANRASLSRVVNVCSVLEATGCPVMVIKSLDHWPDAGNDVDLFTNAPETKVLEVFENLLHARTQPQTWSDRLANKWNFQVLGLKPLIEVHVQRLGQTGELAEYGAGLMKRCRSVTFDGIRAMVPSPEDQIILAALQRLYRHYFFRVCDFVDARQVLEDNFDFEKLRLISKRLGIWTGVATFLRIVSEYVGHYRGTPIRLPAFANKAARFGIERLYPHASYLRLPIFPHGASLYGRQVVKTLKRGRPASALRLGLLPPLAMAAGAAFKMTGNDKGIW